MELSHAINYFQKSETQLAEIEPSIPPMQLDEDLDSGAIFEKPMFDFEDIPDQYKLKLFDKIMDEVDELRW